MQVTTYDPAHAEQVLFLMEDGDSLRRACEKVGITRWSFLRWVDADFDGLAHRYARARDRLLECWAEQIVDISDDGRNDMTEGERGAIVDFDHINRSKLRVDTRKWLLSKLRPDQYGDRSEHRHTGADGKGAVIIQVVTGVPREGE